MDLSMASKTRDAAAELLSRLITRPDLQTHYLESFLSWSTEVLISSGDVFLVRTTKISSHSNLTLAFFTNDERLLHSVLGC